MAGNCTASTRLGRSPAAWTPEYFGGNAVPALGWNSVTVPGAVSAWVELHAKFGKLPFEKLFEPAISYGRNGFLVSPTVAAQWAAQVPLFKSQPGFAEAFLPGGRAPKPGELFTFPDHAATLEQIATTNGEAFYRGELAAKLEAHSSANGGVMRASDLAAHRADWVGTISGTYRGYTIHEIPPNGQGIVALIALGILEQFDMSSLPVDSADSVHLQIEALKLAFADAQAYVADIDHMSVRPEQLLDQEYLRQRVGTDRSEAGKAGRRRCPWWRHRVSDRRRRRGDDGVDDSVELPGIRLRRGGGGHRNLAAKPRRGFRCGSRTSESSRAEQAALPHHHPRLCHQRRRPGDELRGDGRPDATPGPCAGAGAHRRPRTESAGGLRRAPVPVGAGYAGQLRGWVSRRPRSTNFGSAVTTCSPWTTTTVSAAAKRFGAWKAGISRPATRAGTAKPWPSRR